MHTTHVLMKFGYAFASWVSFPTSHGKKSNTKINIQVLEVHRCERAKFELGVLCCCCHLLSLQHSAIFWCFSDEWKACSARCENHFVRSMECIKWTKKCDGVQSHCKKTGKKSAWSKRASFHVLSEWAKWRRCQDTKGKGVSKRVDKRASLYSIISKQWG